MQWTVVLICFFLSGAAGLVYEVCWIRIASLGFGSTTFALSSVLGIFFLGLAIGSHFAGKFATDVRWNADQSWRRLDGADCRRYAGPESGVGKICLG